MEDFKAGDVVKLKGSVSPEMTVSTVTDNGSVSCAWFVHTVSGLKVRREPFLPAMLAKVEE